MASFSLCASLGERAITLIRYRVDIPNFYRVVFISEVTIYVSIFIVCCRGFLFKQTEITMGRKSTEISNDVKKLIVDMKKEGQKTSVIVNLLQIPESTIRCIWKKYLSTGEFRTSKRKGHPRKQSKRDQKWRKLKLCSMLLSFANNGTCGCGTCGCGTWC